MKKLFVFVALLSPLVLSAQSATTRALQDQYDDAFSLFFYKNTLKMINQTDSKEFDDLIKNIDKMKLMVIDKSRNKFGVSNYKKLVQDYKKENYEEIMTSRLDGRTCDVYLREKKGSTLGTVVLVSDSSKLYVLDILGSIDVSKAGSLFSAIDGSSDIGQKLKSFLNKDEKDPARKKVGVHIE